MWFDFIRLDHIGLDANIALVAHGVNGAADTSPPFHDTLNTLHL